jgi:type II secretory pathway pseudopilin PulG
MKKSGTKTSLFLIELIISLLLFAFCAAICMQIFAGAKFRTEDSSALSKSVFLASSAAELYKAYGGDMDKLRGAYGKSSASLSDGRLIVYYDENWQETLLPMLSSQTTHEYIAYTLIVADNSGAGAGITVTSWSYSPESVATTTEVIYSITVKAVDTNGQ